MGGGRAHTGSGREGSHWEGEGGFTLGRVHTGRRGGRVHTGVMEVGVTLQMAQGREWRVREGGVEQERSRAR